MTAATALQLKPGDPIRPSPVVAGNWLDYVIADDTLKPGEYVIDGVFYKDGVIAERESI